MERGNSAEVMWKQIFQIQKKIPAKLKVEIKY